MGAILIIGSGIVGKANGKGLITRGHNVVFIDTNYKVVESLRGEGFNAYMPGKINEISNDNFDVAMFCVPTPIAEDNRNGFNTYWWTRHILH